MKKKLFFGAFGVLLLCGGIAAISIKNAEAGCEISGPAVQFKCVGEGAHGCKISGYGHTLECSGKKAGMDDKVVEDTGTL